MPPASTAEIIAHITNFALIVAAWRFPRVRTYAFALLASDLLRLAFGFFPLHRDGSAHDLFLYAVDGLLVLAPAPVLVWALRLSTLPAVGLSVVALGVALSEVDAGLYDRAAAVYLSALTSAHIYATLGPLLSRKVRRNLDREAAVLLGLAVTGTTGAVVASAWERWDLVNAGNVVAHSVLGIFAFVASRVENRR